MESIRFENEGEESRTEKKGLLAKIGIGNVLNLASFILLGVFYLGIHKSEMAELTKTVQEIKVISEDNTKRIDKIDLNGPEFGRKLAIKVEDNEKHLIKLDAMSELGKQKGGIIDNNLSSLDIRVQRLEEALPKIALLAKDVSNLVESQKDLKVDIRDIFKEIKDISSRVK